MKIIARSSAKKHRQENLLKPDIEEAFSPPLSLASLWGGGEKTHVFVSSGKTVDFLPVTHESLSSSSTMCGRSNEAVLRGGLSHLWGSPANTPRIPVSISAADAASLPGRPSRGECTHPGQ